MWARRCGAPPLWPSRTKVLLQSFFTAALGVAVFNHLTAADVHYLDLTQPRDSRVLCLKEWPLRHEADNWFAQDWYIDWTSYWNDMQSFVNNNMCTPTANITDTCAAINVPLHDMTRKLGTPLGWQTDYEWNNDMLEIYAFIFLYLTVCMWVAVVIHDFALLSQNYQNGVLDIRGVDRHFPIFRKLLCLTLFKMWKKGIREGKGVCKILWKIATPFVFIWATAVIVVIVNPMVLIMFLRAPVRLGRLQIFSLCVAMTVMCVSLTIRCCSQIGSPDARPKYAVTWEAASTAGTCICGCVFPMRSGGLWQIVLMALGIGYKAVMLGLRCLKGLRRANWANLITVLFAVPLTVYPVEWTQPNGKPINMRVEGQPVQGEPAFDPFALMDEQKESSTTTVDLRPTHQNENASKSRNRVNKADKMTAPRMATIALKEAQIYKEEIGCCGFPYLTRSKTGDLDEEEVDDELPMPDSSSPPPPEAQQEAPPAAVEGTTAPAKTEEEPPCSV